MSARIDVVALGLWLFVSCAATCTTEPPTVVIPRRVTKDLYAWYEHTFSWWDLPAYALELLHGLPLSINGVTVCRSDAKVVCDVTIPTEVDVDPMGWPNCCWPPLPRRILDGAIAELVSSGATCLPYREPVCVRLSD